MTKVYLLSSLLISFVATESYAQSCPIDHEMRSQTIRELCNPIGEKVATFVSRQLKKSVKTAVIIDCSLFLTKPGGALSEGSCEGSIRKEVIRRAKNDLRVHYTVVDSDKYDK